MAEMEGRRVDSGGNNGRMRALKLRREKGEEDKRDEKGGKGFDGHKGRKNHTNIRTHILLPRACISIDIMVAYLLIRLTTAMLCLSIHLSVCLSVALSRHFFVHSRH